MNWIFPFLREFWDLITEMAPYLLLGFLAAGVLHVLLRPHFVQRLLGAPGWKSNLRATVLGIPLPVCSCGVLPLAASLKREGASSGSTLAFWTATPQTGVDSILATHALMGPVFTAFRVVVAFVSGWLTGLVTDLLEVGNAEKRSGKEAASPLPEEASCCESETAGAGCEELDIVDDRSSWEKTKSALKYGLVTLPDELARPLIIGLVLAAVLGVWMPVGWIETNLNNAWLTYLLMTLIAVPIYVCSTGSIPLAFAFMKVGISPGAALVFLIAGPATNAATLSVIMKQMGTKLMIGFLATLVFCAWTSGWILDQIPLQIDLEAHHHHEQDVLFWFRQLSGIFLVGLLFWSQIQSWVGKGNEDCCGEEASEAAEGARASAKRN